MSTMRKWLGLAMAPLLGACAHGGPTLHEGDPAPDFAVQGDDGQTYSLAALRGKYVVLYFYPRDDTPGCTKEACGFRDENAALTERGAVVLGVSTDGADSHRAFRKKHNLNFPLLLDGKQLAAAYGVPLRLGFLAARQTFVIDKEGRLLKIFRDVSPLGHAEEVLRALK